MTKHKGKIICAFIVVLVLAGIWYHCEANTIFPLDEEAIIGVIVSEENDCINPEAIAPCRQICKRH